MERTQSPMSGSVYLAFVLAVLLLVIFLLAMKRGYIRRRQAQLAQTRSQFYFRQSLLGHSDGGLESLGRKKAGFLVGFLGSPALETSFLISIPQATHSGSRRSSIQVQVERNRLSTLENFVVGHNTRGLTESLDKSSSAAPDRNSTFAINYETNSITLGSLCVPVELHLATNNNLPVQELSLDHAPAVPGDQLSSGSRRQSDNEASSLASSNNNTISITERDISSLLTFSPGPSSQPSSLNSVKLVVTDVLAQTNFAPWHFLENKAVPHISMSGNWPRMTPSTNMGIMQCQTGTTISVDTIPVSANQNPPSPPPDLIYELPALRGVTRQKKTASISRSRRSPPLGPSPLRSMILPDTPVDSDHTAGGDGAARISCSHVGLGFSSVSQARNKALLHEQVGFKGGDNSDGVLGIIRELVHETNDWDPSLFVDNNFKTLIEQSKSLVRQHEQGHPLHDAVEHPFCRALVAGDASVQVDLNELDVELVQPTTWLAS